MSVKSKVQLDIELTSAAAVIVNGIDVTPEGFTAPKRRLIVHRVDRDYSVELINDDGSSVDMPVKPEDLSRFAMLIQAMVNVPVGD